ncbi:MAG: hypothetical protein EAY72_09010 [Bacteroidetes bacterium]|nr:MAG: hypothetical protein EAY72_09010 [Bacteroidota bacterium]TAE71421.1 MAG: hypothetical protein EAY68_02095 [Bacteroidota bacterium]
MTIYGRNYRIAYRHTKTEKPAAPIEAVAHSPNSPVGGWGALGRGLQADSGKSCPNSNNTYTP